MTASTSRSRNPVPSLTAAVAATLRKRLPRLSAVVTATPRIFVSTATADLRTTRSRITEALIKKDCFPVVQEHFPLESQYGTVQEMLRRRIRNCHAVIHIAGQRYGAEPRVREESQPRRSYTQMEFDIARELGKPLYLFVCTDEYHFFDPPRKTDPVEEPQETRELQEEHREVLARSDQLRLKAASMEEIEKEVLTLQPEVEILRQELRIQQRRLFWTSGVIMAGLLLLAGISLFIKRDTSHVVSGVRSLREDVERLAAEVRENMGQSSGGQGQVHSGDPYESALLHVAAKHGATVSDLREMIARWIGTLRNSPAPDSYQLAIADYLQGKNASAAMNGDLSIEETTHRLNEARTDEAYQREELARRHVVTGDARAANGQMDVAMQHYQSALALVDRTDDPLTWGEIAARIAEQDRQQGRYTEAEPRQREVIKILRENFGDNNFSLIGHQVRLADILINLAGTGSPQPPPEVTQLMEDALRLVNLVYQSQPANRGAWLGALGKAWRTFGRSPAEKEKAETLLRQALAALDDDEAAPPLLRAEAHLELGRACLDRGEPGLSLKHYAEAEKHFRLAGTDGNIGAIEALHGQAHALEFQGKHPQAEAAFRKSLAESDALGDANNTACVKYRKCLSSFLRTLGRPREARKLAEEALTRAQGIKPPNSPVTAMALHELAHGLDALGEESQAAEKYEAAIQFEAQTPAPDLDTIAYFHHCAGSFFERRNRPREAETHFREALRLYTRLHGAEDVQTLDSEKQLAKNLSGQQKHAEAEPLLRHLLQTAETQSGKDSPALLPLMDLMGPNLLKQDHLVEAREISQRQLAIAERHHGSTSEALIVPLSVLLAIHQKQEDWAAVETAGRRILAVADALPEKDPEASLTPFLVIIATALQQQGKVEEAIAMRRRIVEINEKEHGPEAILLGLHLNDLAVVLLETGKIDEAGTLLRRAVALEEKRPAAGLPRDRAPHYNLGLVLEQQGRHTDAGASFQKAFEFAVATRGNSPGAGNPQEEICRASYLASLIAQGLDETTAEARVKQVEAAALGQKPE